MPLVFAKTLTARQGGPGSQESLTFDSSRAKYVSKPSGASLIARDDWTYNPESSSTVEETLIPQHERNGSEIDASDCTPVISIPLPDRYTNPQFRIAIGIVAGVLVAGCAFWVGIIYSRSSVTSIVNVPTETFPSDGSHPKPSPSVASTLDGADQSTVGTDSSAAEQPATGPAASTTTNLEESPEAGDGTTDRPGSKQTVQDAVSAWANAFRTKNSTALAASYAPSVEKYFRRENVGRELVQRYFESAFARIVDIRTYKIADIAVQMLPTEGPAYESSPQPRAAATFHKTWETTQTDGKTFAGEEIEKLTFARFSEGWQIVREEELNVIRASKR